jgi:peptidylprolyl isomerase domain and WD repeat-containing protein 1
VNLFLAVLVDEPLHLGRLPSCELYENSYMHRDEITHQVMTRTDFYITGSRDGFVKFWKKNLPGIEFVKVFKAHIGTLSNHFCVLLVEGKV